MHTMYNIWKTEIDVTRRYWNENASEINWYKIKYIYIFFKIQVE